MKPTNSFQRKLITAAVAMATTGGTQYSIADEKSAGFSLEEVMVTATRRSVSTEDVPYNISAISGETLGKKGIVDFTKLARSTTGLTFVETGARDSGINSGLIIRGLNTNTSGSDDIPPLVATTVSTYIGETPAFINLHLKDIERVEVLRGPQGTLYGSGSLGGTIRYIHNKPNPEAFEAEVASRISQTKHASGLNSDTYGMVNMPLSDKVALRLVGGYVENQGFIDQNGLVSLDANGGIVADPADPNARPLFHSESDTNDDDTSHARASLSWDISDDTSALLYYQYQKDDAGARQVVNPYHPDGGKYANTQTVLETLERDVELYGIDIESDLGFATLSATLSHYENEAAFIGDQNGLYLNSAFYYFSTGSDGAPREALYGDYENKDSGTPLEIRLTSNGEGAIDYVAGFFWLEQDFDTLQRDIHPGFYDHFGYAQHGTSHGVNELKDSTYHQEIETTYTDKALFGEATYHISDALQVTLGVRAFEQEYESDNTIRFGTNPTGVFDPVDVVTKEKFDDEIWKFNVSYNATEDIMLYGTWAEGFRHGGTNGVPVISDFAPGTAPGVTEPDELRTFESDTATNWEFGIKGNAMDGRMRFSTALYMIEWENIQIESLTPNAFLPGVLNGETAETQGLEAEVTMALTESLEMTLGYTYVNAELTETFDVDGDGTNEGEDGDSLPGVPEHAANIALSYTTALANGMDLSLNLNGSYLDEVATALNSSLRDYAEVDSYSLWDTSVSLTTDNWSVTLFVDNLLDKQALTNTRSLSGFNYDPTADTGVTRNPAERGRELLSFTNRPRTIGLGAKYTF